MIEIRQIQYPRTPLWSLCPEAYFRFLYFKSWHFLNIPSQILFFKNSPIVSSNNCKLNPVYINKSNLDNSVLAFFSVFHRYDFRLNGYEARQAANAVNMNTVLFISTVYRKQKKNQYFSFYFIYLFFILVIISLVIHNHKMARFRPNSITWICSTLSGEFRKTQTCFVLQTSDKKSLKT